VKREIQWGNERGRFDVAVSSNDPSNGKVQYRIAPGGGGGDTDREKERGGIGAAWPLVREFITPSGVNRNLFYGARIRRAAPRRILTRRRRAIVAAVRYSPSARTSFIPFPPSPFRVRARRDNKYLRIDLTRRSRILINANEARH